MGFGILILASGPLPGINVLNILTLENSIVASIASVITLFTFFFTLPFGN